MPLHPPLSVLGEDPHAHTPRRIEVCSAASPVWSIHARMNREEIKFISFRTLCPPFPVSTVLARASLTRLILCEPSFHLCRRVCTGPCLLESTPRSFLSFSTLSPICCLSLVLSVSLRVYLYRHCSPPTLPSLSFFFCRFYISCLVILWYMPAHQLAFTKAG